MEYPARTIKLILRYDGTSFHGFAKQRDGIRTVQGDLESALESILGHPAETTGAARTDAGVHALGQTVSFTASTPIPPDRIAPALNNRLPEDIVAVSSAEAPEGFNARFSAIGKEYNYVAYQSRLPIPFLRNTALRVPEALDVPAMEKAFSFFKGEHDFSAFRNEGSTPSNPVRTINSTFIRKNGCFLIFGVHGSGFLYRMVRNIVGTVLEAGYGRKKPDDIPGIIESRDRAKAGPCLPPQGLYLARVDY